MGPCSPCGSDCPHRIRAFHAGSGRACGAVGRQLFSNVVAAVGGAEEVNLLAASDHPLVGPTMRRVVDRRLAYPREIFRALGCPADEADRRAKLAYAAYLAASSWRCTPRDQQAYVNTSPGSLTS